MALIQEKAVSQAGQYKKSKSGVLRVFFHQREINETGGHPQVRGHQEKSDTGIHQHPGPPGAMDPTVDFTREKPKKIRPVKIIIQFQAVSVYQMPKRSPDDQGNTGYHTHPQKGSNKPVEVQRIPLGG
jgi:hypothetical protein